MTISRPDMGNATRTVDTVYATDIGTVEKSKVKLLHRISLDEAFGYIKKSKIFGVYPQ
jgi:SH3-like domain-containing protein